MKVLVCNNEELNLSRSHLNNETPIVDGEVKVTGVGVFDENGKVLPLISEYLSYQTTHEIMAFTSAPTIGRNLCYFLDYIRTRKDYAKHESDEVFLTVPKYVIREYLTKLARDDGKASGTIRNRDASISGFITFLCEENEDRPALREHNPYKGGLLSKTPKKEPVIACSFDDLYTLTQFTSSERERTILQFLYDSGLRRSELGRVTRQHINDALNFDRTEFIAKSSDAPIKSEYAPLYVLGSKGRKNEIKPRYTLISRASLSRIKKYHSSPLYKKYAKNYKGAENTPAFFNASGTPFTPSAVSKLLERISGRAVKLQRLSNDISPHKLRHGNAYAILQSQDEGDDYLDRMVRVQKSFGHSGLTTTEMYTSIPQDIYNSMADENGELLTRAKKMQRLVEMTQLRINLKDRK